MSLPPESSPPSGKSPSDSAFARDPDAASTTAANRVLTVTEAEAGERLDVYLASHLGVSRSEVRRLLDRAAVRVGGRLQSVGDKGRAVLPGEQLAVERFTRPEAQSILPEADDAPPVPIVASGPGWVAVGKPAGVAVHPLRETERGTVLNSLVSEYPEIQGVGEGGLRSGVLHRLDLDTTGVLLVATRSALWERVRTAFREHRMEKHYRAIVSGALRREQSLRLGLVVAQHRPARVRVVPCEAAIANGSVRITHLRVRPLEHFANATLVEVQPSTGFLHQIRASLAHIGHPLLGDATYGAPEQRWGASRHMLHASRIRFEEIAAQCPDAEDFARLLEWLRRA